MRLALLFLAEVTIFLLASVNQRATAKYRMGPTLFSDAAIAAVGFTVVKWVVEATSPLEQIVYVAGATVGSYLGMRWTRTWEQN